LKINRCRACDSTKLESFINLGSLPISNNYLEYLDEEYSKFDLNLLVCTSCAFLQLSESHDPQVHFNEKYPYFSGYSSTWVSHCEKSAHHFQNLLNLSQGDLVLEIASNDGTMLNEFKKNGIRVLGVDPSSSVAKFANTKGLETIINFFSSALSSEILSKYGFPKLILGCNVLAHVPNIRDFIKGVQNLMSDETVACFEFPHASKMIKYAQFDTIYHEHYSYITLQSLIPLLTEFGLHVYRVEEIDLHGGSLRVYICKDIGKFPIQKSVADILHFETEFSPLRESVKRDFNLKARNIATSLNTLVRNLKKQGRQIIVFGAAAKGTTLLNFSKIDNSLISFAIDSSLAKQGRYIPGTKIEIKSPEILEDYDLDIVLILAWNFTVEITNLLREKSKKKISIIVPVPEVKMFEI
jgi:C-methyltransferase C-terminal domain/Putative zinc binding domain/Methyltransferase domain